MPRKKPFFFPAVERMGQQAVTIKNLTHGYGDTRLFDDSSLEIERGERVALIGASMLTHSCSLRQLPNRSMSPSPAHPMCSERPGDPEPRVDQL